MIEVVKFKIEHFDKLDEQESTRKLSSFITRDHMRSLETCEYSFSALKGDKVLFCAGIVEYWKNRGEGWMLFDKNCKSDFVALHNITKRFLDSVPIRRIEAAVDEYFLPGHRWMRLLGFKLEARVLEGYRPEGGNCSLYARVKNG